MMQTVTFEHLNLNPRGRKTADCVIRALAAVTGGSYKDVLLELANIQIETGHDMSTKYGYERFLTSRGWVKHKQPRKIDGSKYLVGEIGNLVRPYERVIITMVHHMTVKMNQSIYDIWDCRRKTIGNYYTHPDDMPY
jgi:hypothetical protein